MVRRDEIAPGTRFQQRGGLNHLWEVKRFFDAVDGRRYAVLARVDNPQDQKTLAVNGLRDGGLFRRIMPTAPEPVATTEA